MLVSSQRNDKRPAKLHQTSRRKVPATLPAKGSAQRRPSYVCQGRLVPLQEAAEKENIAKKKSRRGGEDAGVACLSNSALCGNPAGHCVHDELILSDHLLPERPSRCRDRRSWLRFVIERSCVVLSFEFHPNRPRLHHGENFAELTSPVTPPHFSGTPRSPQLRSQGRPLIFSYRQEAVLKRS